MELEAVEAILQEQGYPDYRWISGKEVELGHWVRLKCMYGCPSYGKNLSCPPNVPTVKECKKIFKDYKHILVLKFSRTFEDPSELGAWTNEINKGLLKLEHAVFMKGHHKAMALYCDECRLCDKGCPKGERRNCKDQANARPSPEGMGVDVYTTVRKAGFEIKVLEEKTEEMSRFAFLLVE